jgi:hypothetical protein
VKAGQWRYYAKPHQKIFQKATRHLPYSFGEGGWRPTISERRNTTPYTSMVGSKTEAPILLTGQPEISSTISHD